MIPETNNLKMDIKIKLDKMPWAQIIFEASRLGIESKIVFCLDENHPLLNFPPKSM